MKICTLNETYERKRKYAITILINTNHSQTSVIHVLPRIDNNTGVTPIRNFLPVLRIPALWIIEVNVLVMHIVHWQIRFWHYSTYHDFPSCLRDERKAAVHGSVRSCIGVDS